MSYRYDLSEFESMTREQVVELIEKEYPNGLQAEYLSGRDPYIGFNLNRYFYASERPAVLHAVRDCLDPFCQPLSYGCPIPPHVEHYTTKEGVPYWEVVTG